MNKPKRYSVSAVARLPDAAGEVVAVAIGAGVEA